MLRYQPLRVILFFAFPSLEMPSKATPTGELPECGRVRDDRIVDRACDQRIRNGLVRLEGVISVSKLL